MGDADVRGDPGRSAPPPEQTLEQSLRHEHRLSALALQVISTLGMSQEAVDRLVAEQLARNPALIGGAPRRCRWCAAPLRSGRCPRCVVALPLLTDPVTEDDAREKLRLEARQLVPAGYEDAVDLVVAHLDARGLLPGGLGALPAAGLRRTRLATALRAVQEAGPPGTGAPDAVTGLLAQALWHADHGGPRVLVPLVRDHLSAVATRPAAAADVLGVPLADVEEAVRFLRTRMTPAPLSLSEGRRPAPPDVIMRRTDDGELVAVVLGTADLGLDVAAGPGGGPGWQSACAEARALVDVLDRRADALQRVADVLAHRQRDFVLRGPRWHRPLTRSQVAHELDLHPSTVSRAVRGAVAAVPQGRSLPLADFFGGAVSAREALAELLHGQDPPRTDTDAAVRLARDGFVVARRTVAKYRHQIERRTG